MYVKTSLNKNRDYKFFIFLDRASFQCLCLEKYLLPHNFSLNVYKWKYWRKKLINFYQGSLIYVHRYILNWILSRASLPPIFKFIYKIDMKNSKLLFRKSKSLKKTNFYLSLNKWLYSNHATQSKILFKNASYSLISFYTKRKINVVAINAFLYLFVQESS